MKLISLLFFILLSTTQIFAKKNFVVDKNLQKLRQEYREFRIDKKILLDKSFFEIYNEIDKQLTEVQEPLERTYQIWSKSCSKFPIAVLDEETKKKFETFCANGLNLLANSLKIRQKALNTFFSGDLVSLSPPMYFFEDLCDEIEAQVDQIWGYYIHNNSSCVAIMFDSFLSLFSPVIDDVIKMGKNVKENVKKDFKNFQKTAKNTLKVVEKMVDKFDLCISVKDINSCMWKLIIKETECNGECGKFFSSIRSVVWSVTNAAQQILNIYEKNLRKFEKTENIVEDKIIDWLRMTEENCL